MLLKPSKRSNVPPFIVMDVMAAAAQREAQGAHIIHMEVGQPAAPAPAAAIRRRRPRLYMVVSAIPKLWEYRHCGRVSRVTTKILTIYLSIRHVWW